jgi:lactoylglutathione lyase
MNRIVHIALKVDDLERSRQFYENIFGFRENKTEKVRDHTSCHLSDGAIDLSIMQYDAGTQSAESKAAGEGPCIHHFAVERQIRAFGCDIISDPGVIPVKFRAPGGTVCEIVPKLRYKKVKKAASKATRKAKAERTAKKRAKKK